VFGRIFDRRGWDLSHLSDPLGGSLLGFEQSLHGHGLVEMVLGLGDLFSDQMGAWAPVLKITLSVPGLLEPF
jgi:hypothetical protein